MSTKVLNKIVNICSEITTGTTLVDLFYPVGSIYTSMNSTDPSELFGGTWEQITDRFLYCADSSKQTGGSKTITTDNLPSHTHAFTGTAATDSVQFRSTTTGNTIENKSNKGILTVESDAGMTASYAITTESSSNDFEVLTFNYTPSGTLSSTGSGAEFLPPYITVYAWYRSA